MTNGAPYPYEPPPRDRRTAPAGGTAPGGRGGARGTTRRRPPAHKLIPLAIAAWAVLEIWLLTVVADAAGGLTVLLLLAAGFVLGAVVVRRAGRRAWRELSSAFATAAGPQTGREQEERRGGNTFAMLGGLLLMVPGLVSDVAGLLCLFPPTAKLLRRTAERRIAGFGGGQLGDAMRQARSARRASSEDQAHIRRPDGRIVQGEVIRDDAPPVCRPRQADLRLLSRGCTAMFMVPERRTASRSASTSSSSSRVRRSMSMSQCVRAGLPFFSSGPSPSTSSACAPHTLHSHSGGISASTENGISKRWPFWHAYSTAWRGARSMPRSVS